jgi:Uma2 family endonuclease
MNSATFSPSLCLTAADLVARVGDVPLQRICFDPAPGAATEQDLVDLHAKTGRLYELVNGILVEKAIGFAESFLAVNLCCHLANWVKPRNLGAVVGAGGTMRLAPGLVRIPDVSFAYWHRFPNRQVQLDQPIPNLVPDLAAEVLKLGNTANEIDRKSREYFGRGTSAVWVIDPRARTVEVFASPINSTLLHEADTLTGDPVLPGFTLPMRQLFAELDPH